MGIAAASLALFFPLMWLHRAYTFGTPQLPAPQAGLMASLAQGIVGGNMAWPLVVVGIFMGFGLILVEVKSPMLFSVGMYLPLETTFAIFVGGVFRWLTDKYRDRGNFNEAQRARIENAGVLTAAGLIAGEALCGLVVAGFRAAEKSKGHAILPDATWGGSAWLSILVLVGLAALMIRLPLGERRTAGRTRAADGDHVDCKGETMRPADTSPEAWKVFLDIQRRMPAEAKLRRAFEYSKFVRGLAEGMLRRQHPHASEREIFLREARQRLGADLYQQVYGGEFPDDRPITRKSA